MRARTAMTDSSGKPLSPSASPKSRPPEKTGKSLLLNLLTTRTDRRDTKVFAHAAAETQNAINDTYSATTRMLAIGSGGGQQQQATEAPGFLEVFPRVTSRPPRLLQDLETELVDRLRSNDKLSTTATLLDRDRRDPCMSENLWLDAHRHIFAAFREGFGTYAPLLGRIQEEFEAALDQGIRCTMENVELRQRLGVEEARRCRCQGDLRSKIMQGELEYRKVAFAKLQELKSRMDRAVKRAALAEKELAKTQSDEIRLLALVAKLKDQHHNLLALQRKEMEWNGLPHSSTLANLTIGALSKEDQSWLDSEYVPSSIKTLPLTRAPSGPIDLIDPSSLAAAARGEGDQLEPAAIQSAFAAASNA